MVSCEIVNALWMLCNTISIFQFPCTFIEFRNRGIAFNGPFASSMLEFSLSHIAIFSRQLGENTLCGPIGTQSGTKLCDPECLSSDPDILGVHYAAWWRIWCMLFICVQGTCDH